MIQKLKNSLAYRLPQFYRAWLAKRSFPSFIAKENTDITVVTMTGKKLIDMTRLSILSIARSWDKLPRLIIITDGTISTTAIKEKLLFWKGELQIEDWQSTAQYHLNKKRNSLVNYAHHHVLGKKMAVIFHYAELTPILWLDSDILFFNDFIKYIPHHNGEEMICAGSEDYSAVYDDRVLNFYGNNLYDLYKFNSGVLFVYGIDIYERFNIEMLLNELTSYHYFFTEQTVFAHIASKSKGILWTTAVIKNFNSDNQQLKPMSVTNVIGRHYTTNVRHLFWRDAFSNLN